MICIPLDDVEDVLQRRLDDCPAWTPDGQLWRMALVTLIDELTALRVDTEAPACQECGDPGLKHCRYGVYYCEPCWDALSS